VVVGRLGYVLVVGLPVFPLAGIAVADADRASAIVARLVAEHIEEQSVHAILVKAFGEDLHGLHAVVIAVDAGGVEAVIDDGLAVGLAEKPLGVRVEDGLGSLAEIESSDHANFAGMSFAENVAKHVAARRQERAGIVKLGR